MVLARLLLSGIVASAIAVGCGSKGGVSLLAHVDQVELAARPNALDLLVLDGGFTLVLELGEAAPRSTSVSLGAFSIESDAGIVVDRLSVACDVEFPVKLAAGDRTTARCELSAGQVVDPAEGDPCAGEVWLAGTVTDSLSDGRPTRVLSNRFRVSCE